MVSQATPRYISKRKSQYTHKKTCKNVHNSFNCNNLKMKTTSMLNNKRMNDDNGYYTEKKNSIQINILKNCFEQTKSDTKAYSLNGMFIWISRAGEMNWWWPKLEWRLLLADLVAVTGVGRREPPRDGHGINFDLGSGHVLCTKIKIHRAVHRAVYKWIFALDNM